MGFLPIYTRHKIYVISICYSSQQIKIFMLLLNQHGIMMKFEYTISYRITHNHIQRSDPRPKKVTEQNILSQLYKSSEINVKFKKKMKIK